MELPMPVYEKGTVFSQGYQYVKGAILLYPDRSLLYFIHRVTPDAPQDFKVMGILFLEETVGF